MGLVDEFAAAFGVWDIARPYLHLMVDEAEMTLVVRMAGRAVTVEEAADLLGLPPAATETLLQRAYARHILNKKVEDGTTRFTPADFPTRLDHFAKFENWDDIPEAGRRALDRRFLDEFIARHRPNVERKTQGLAAENALPNDTVLLLHEVEAMLDAASDIIVQPCDCRRLGGNCDRPVETCIWLDAGAREALDRGYGRRLTREEAKALVRRLDRQGLMHTGDSEWPSRGLHAICNCCACDCYPFRAARELGSKGVWPKSRAVATHDPARCSRCGLCAQRCHFGAFSATLLPDEDRPVIRFDAELCWGCGLCANSCPEQAIVMQPVGSGA
jgi:Pyruvate/2-oxoacid:ferredoxin oxidoreductase delta subunit